MPPKRLTRDEQRQATRSALLEAGARVFIERGFAGASVEAIAEEAGYTRGAFYSNFETKEELFAEVLQERVYTAYREMAADAAAAPEAHPGPRATGEQLAEILASPDGHWLFRLWLELLAHAGRDERFREIAAGFWSGTRALTTQSLDQRFRAAGVTPPVPPDQLASSMIALDIGLALQHFVDPDAVPLSVYPDLFELLFGPLAEATEP